MAEEDFILLKVPVEVWRVLKYPKQWNKHKIHLMMNLIVLE